MNSIAINDSVKNLCNVLLTDGDQSAYYEKVKDYCEKLPLFNRKESIGKLKELVNDFAKTFTGKDMTEALNELNDHRNEVPHKDLMPIAFMGGVNVMLVIMLSMLIGACDQL